MSTYIPAQCQLKSVYPYLKIGECADPDNLGQASISTNPEAHKTQLSCLIMDDIREARRVIVSKSP